MEPKNLQSMLSWDYIPTEDKLKIKRWRSELYLMLDIDTCN